MYNEMIDEALMEDELVEEYQRDESFAIRDFGLAVWADGIVNENEKKIEEIEKIHKQRIDDFKYKLDKWKEEASKKHLNTIDFFKVHLHAYHMRVLDEEKARNAKKLSKTIKLPTRSLTCVKQQPDILINGKEASKAKDEPIFVQFVKENNPEFIKEEVKWGDYKKTLKQTEHEGKLVYVDSSGQPVEFIQLIERGEKMEWKKNKEE